MKTSEDSKRQTGSEQKNDNQQAEGMINVCYDTREKKTHEFNHLI